MLHLLLLCTQAFAADPTYAATEKPGQKFDKPESHLSVELGGAWTTGNTVSFSLNGALAGSHRWLRNKLTLNLGANVGRAIVDTNGDGHLDATERAVGDVETAKKYGGDLRYDR